MSSRNFSLHQAIKSGNAESVRAVLAGGADVNQTNDAGQTPLILAIVAGKHQCLRPLLRAGADPWVRDHHGLNAIDWATRKGETQLAQSLSTHSQSEAIDNPSESVRPPTRQQKMPPPPVEDAPRTHLSPDEKARRFITGLKQRLDEKAGRDLPNHPTQTEEQQPADFEKLLNALIPEVKTTEPPIQEPPVIAKKSGPPELPKPVARETIADQAKAAREQAIRETQRQAPESVTPDLPKKVDVVEKPAPPTRDQQTVTRQQTTRRSSRKAVDVLKEIVTPAILRKLDVVADTESPATLSSASPQPKTTHSSAKRKRCPQCGAIYNSELLAYCSYDSVALVDEGAPIVTPRSSNSSSLLWILVILVALLGAIAGLFVTERLLQQPDDETPAVTASQPPASQKGVPVLRGQIEGKEMSLPVAEVPADTVTEPTSVRVRIRVDRAGRVYSADSTNDEEVLREAAILAARKSTFSVEKLRGRGAQGIITYTFK